MQQSINLDRELNYLPYRLRYHSHSRRKPPKTSTPTHRRAPSLNNRPQKSRPIMQNLQIEIARRSEEEASCSSRSGEPFQEEECITTCQTDRVKPSQEAVAHEQGTQKTSEWGVFGLQEMQDMKNMLCLDLAEENSEEKAKTTSLKQLKQEGSNKRNDLKDDKEGSEVNTDFVKTTVLLQGSPKDNDSRRNSFQFTMKGPEDIFNKCIQVQEISKNRQKDYEMAQMKEAISMKCLPSKSNTEKKVYEAQSKQATRISKALGDVDSKISQNITFKCEDMAINQLEKKLRESGLFGQCPSKQDSIKPQQNSKVSDTISFQKQLELSQQAIVQRKMAELEAKISSIKIESSQTISPIKRIQEENYHKGQKISECPKINNPNLVQIQQGNYRIKDEEDEIDDWKWVQPMTQRANANNIKYMRKPNSHYRDNIGQQKKEVVEAKVLKKQDKSIFPPKKDKPEIKYQANLLNSNLKSHSRSSKNDFIKIENQQPKKQATPQTISMRPKSSIFQKNERIERQKDIIQLQSANDSNTTNNNEQYSGNTQIKQMEKTLPISPQHNLDIPAAESPIRPRINFKKALASTPQRSDVLLQSRQSKISGCSSRQNSSGAIPSQSAQNLIYLMGSEHLKQLSSLVMEQRNSQVESSDVLSQQLQRVLDQESPPQQTSGYALSLDQSLSSSFRFQPQEQEQESTFNLQAALLEDSLLSPTLTSQTQTVLTPEIATFSDLRQGLTAKHKEFSTKNTQKAEEIKQITFQQVESSKYQKFSGFVETSRSKNTDKKPALPSERKMERQSKLGKLQEGISKSGVSIGNKSMGRRDKSRMQKNLSRFKTRINS